MLAGCSNTAQNKITVEFSEQETVEVNTKQNPCSFLKKINDEIIEESLYQDKLSFHFKKFNVECLSEIDSEKIGNQTLLYNINKQQFKKEISIVDTTKPELNLKEKYEVEEGNTYFNLLKEIEVKDNYTKNLAVGLNGKYDVTKIGEYKIEVVVKDESNNQTKKETVINVVQKEKEVVKEVVELPAQQKEKKGGSNDHPQLKKESKQGSYKKFLFADGYNFNTSFSACNEYLNQVGTGLCSPIKNAEGIYTGYEFIP